MMKKKLLVLITLLFAFTSHAQDDILYWDFGGRNLGDGYKNMLPLDYLNAWGGKTARSIGPEVVGNSVEYLNAHPFWQMKWNNTDFRFGLQSVDEDDNADGVFISGGSEFTRPADLPLLDPEVNLAHAPGSNNDRIQSVRPDVTRHGERTLMPDGDAAFASHFPGCINFTSAGTRNPGRGFKLFGVKAGDVVTIVGAGVISAPDDDIPPRTGAFVFEQLDPFAGIQRDVDEGDGPQDDSVRVIKFTANSDGFYRIGYDFGTIRIYRIYLGDVDVDVSPDSELIKVMDFGSEQLDPMVYDNVLDNYWLNKELGTPPSTGLEGRDLITESLLYDLGTTPGDLSNYLGLGGNYHGHFFQYDTWFIHNSTGSDRWRATDPDLESYDNNVGGPAAALGLTGRIYVNSNGARERYFGIRPWMDNQTVTIIFRGENVGSPSTINVEPIEYQRTVAGATKSFEFSDTNMKALKLILPNADVDYQIWDAVGKLSVYRIYFGDIPLEDLPVESANDVIGESLSVAQTNASISTDINAIGNRIQISNVSTTTQVNIYSLTGALVKSIETNEDVTFDFAPGIWIAKLQSSEGQETVKLLTR